MAVKRRASKSYTEPRSRSLKKPSPVAAQVRHEPGSTVAASTGMSEFGNKNGADGQARTADRRFEVLDVWGIKRREDD